MTGFGKGERENDNWKVTTFIKSVNGKTLDIYIKSNVNLLTVEHTLRKRVKEYVKRGTLNVNIEVKPKRQDYILDTERIREGVNVIKSLIKELSLNVSDDVIFSIGWRYAEKSMEEMDPELEKVILESLDEALKELVKNREEEGQALRKDMEERLKDIERFLQAILENRERIYESIKKKILEKAESFNIGEKDPVVINEITFLLSKLDIEEEITRLRSHISKAWYLLNSGDEVGRKLDFVLQEMHREITTLGNKMPDLSDYVVEIKTQIDRLKQQVANLE